MAAIEFFNLGYRQRGPCGARIQKFLFRRAELQAGLLPKGEREADGVEVADLSSDIEN